jgi:hypothetical protein
MLKFQTVRFAWCDAYVRESTTRRVGGFNLILVNLVNVVIVN